MNFKDLDVWQNSFKLSVKIIKITKTFPSEEKFSLTSQINRSAVSIPSNIAEGHGRDSKQDCIRFLNISKGSANELETQIMIAKELRYIEEEITNPIIQEIHTILKQLTNLQKALKNR